MPAKVVLSCRTRPDPMMREELLDAIPRETILEVLAEKLNAQDIAKLRQ